MSIGKDFRGRTKRYDNNPSVKTRWSKGQSGNPLGRPKRPEIEELRKALAIAKKNNGGTSFLEQFVAKAYTDKDYAVALFKRIIPSEGFVTKEERKLIVNMKGKLDNQREQVDAEVQ